MAQPSNHPIDQPPFVTHISKHISATEAAPILEKFLEASRKAPHLHPDAWLLAEGVRHGPKSGPSGGIAMHHLRRIEAGLRGEALDVESKEELRAKFGEEAVPIEARTGDVFAGNGEEKKVSDDMRLDATIEEEEQKRQKEVQQSGGAQESEKAKRKREKKERTEREKANKRKHEETEEEAKENLSPAEEQPQKRIKTEHDSDAEIPTKKESTPAPGKKTKKDKKDKTEKKSKVKKEEDDTDSKVKLEELPVKEEEWQTQQEYEQSQTILEGEVGERDGAPMSRQDAKPPVVVKHNAKGDVKVPEKPKTDTEKAERKAAKKARRAEEKAKSKAG